MIKILKAIINSVKQVLLNIRGEVCDPKPKHSKIPKHEIEAIAKCLLPDVIAFFESAEGKKEFDEWNKSEQVRLANSQKTA